MMQRKLVTMAMALCLGGPALAAPAGPPAAPVAPVAAAAPSAQSLALAERFIAASHFDESFARVMKVLIPTMSNLAMRNTPNVTAADKAAFEAVLLNAVTEFQPAFRKRLEVLVAQTYTNDELRAANTFYESPQGRSMLAKQAGISAASQALTAQMMPQFQAILRRKLCAKIDCSKLGAPAARQS